MNSRFVESCRYTLKKIAINSDQNYSAIMKFSNNEVDSKKQYSLKVFTAKQLLNNIRISISEIIQIRIQEIMKF